MCLLCFYKRESDGKSPITKLLGALTPATTFVVDAPDVSGLNGFMGPPFNLQEGGGGLEFFSRTKNLYYTLARRRAENVKFHHMYI